MGVWLGVRTLWGGQRTVVESFLLAAHFSYEAGIVFMFWVSHLFIQLCISTLKIPNISSQNRPT